MCIKIEEKSHDHDYLNILPTIYWKFIFFIKHMNIVENLINKFPFFLRSSQSARVSCHIHSTLYVGVWWCSQVVLRKILCTRTPWIAGLRSANKKEQRPSSRVHCQTCSVELVALSSWSSMTNSRSSFKSFKIIIIIIVVKPTNQQTITTTIATFILTAVKL